MDPKLREAFDAKFYLETYADVAASGMDPWEHYVQFGRAEGRVASAGELSAKESESFDAEFYLASNPDVAAAAVDPYEHYVLFGKAEGRKGAPEPPATGQAEDLEKQRAARSGLAVFDPEFYLEAAPDVAASGMSALDHYLNYGRAEGRPSHPLDVASQWRGDRFGSARPKVIVVSHDASRTGAPVVALNICQQLSARADVIAILLAGGPLVENFRQGCCETLVLEKPEMRHAVVLARLIRDIRERVKVDHAIVNSTESRMMVKPLVDQGVRVLFLVHEYISYLHSRTSTDEAINQASVVVVSSRPVLEDAINDDTRTALERAVLLRQGKSVIPPSEAESAEAAKRLRGIDDREEAPDTVDRVKALLESITPRPRLVLGAGTVQFRKGVDLFFAVGLALRRHAPDDNTLFVWVGHDNESDLSYTACLSMQMRELERAGGNAKLFGVTSRLEELYGLADIFLLPSRMDPLPNVAIDAMTVGLPVLCFEGAGGIPEVLADSAHGEVSVAPFSDVAEVARRLDALAHDSHLRDAVGAENRRIAQDAFDMNAYVERLVALLWAEAPATI
ncbi:Spore coat protein SA [Caballeronia calidae]|uniref:Spore coat protein SA n=2 Tax=Caballeronia calidae TaxID=1777139 RepID=A0A158ECD0_9BURK|nr:Spore coat protein SA [Caballeronia calidae]